MVLIASGGQVHVDYTKGVRSKSGLMSRLPASKVVLQGAVTDTYSMCALDQYSSLLRFNGLSALPKGISCPARLVSHGGGACREL